MRALGFLLCFGFLMGGVSVAGTADHLPGVGTFAYTGSPVVSDAPVLLAMATR